jgi:hypothetical protein
MVIFTGIFPPSWGDFPDGNGYSSSLNAVPASQQPCHASIRRNSKPFLKRVRALIEPLATMSHEATLICATLCCVLAALHKCRLHCCAPRCRARLPDASDARIRATCRREALSAETISVARYVLPRGPLRSELLAALRQARKARRPRARGTDRRGPIPHMAPMAERHRQRRHPHSAWPLGRRPDQGGPQWDRPSELW